MPKSTITMQKAAVITKKGKTYTPLNASYEERKTWYLSARWKTFRKAYLREYPHCVFCFKRHIIEPAVIVDHIDGHQVGEDENGKTWKDTFWTGPVQGLCWSCHSRKTVLEDQRNKPKRLTRMERRALLEQGD